MKRDTHIYETIEAGAAFLNKCCRWQVISRPIHSVLSLGKALYPACLGFTQAEKMSTGELEMD